MSEPKFDKNYARKKLKLVLRDLNDYTADEFWREINRVTSGATGLPSAEQLQARVKELAAINLGLTKTLVEMEAENAKAMREASSLTMSLWKRHYQDASPEFGLCDSVAGIISQIDNMTAGISNDLKQMEAENTELRKAGDALRQELHIFVVSHGHPHSAAPLVAIAEWHNITQQADDEGEE